MNILIKNATIMTLESKDKVLESGFIGITGDRVSYVGKSAPEGFMPDEVIDGSDRAVLPGLINMHSHSPMVLMRSYADDLCLQDWLFKKIFPLEAELSPEDVYWGSLHAIMEMVSSGITCFTDMYFHADEIARAVKESGIRACLCTGLHNTGKDGDFSNNRYIVENKRLFKEWNGEGNGRISVYLGPHSIYTCDPEFLRYIAEVAGQLDTGIHIHVSETAKENYECIEKYGKTPVALLEEVGLLSSKTLAAHCVHITDEDMDILKEREVSIVYNPSSNLKLGSGIIPLKRVLQKGINVALGTDGASSNNNLNMFEEMNLAALISKGVEMDPTLVDAYRALQMATVNGAKALRKEMEFGRIKPGMKADLTLINLDKLHLYPMYNIVSNSIYSAQASDVETVIIDGKVVMKNREFTAIDREQVIYNLKRIAGRISGIL